MKRFICGFLTGAIIFSMLGAFAVSYIAEPVDFKVMVNGEEFVSDPPALQVDGRTYLPLRAMGEALGVPVNWNEELRQAEVGTTTAEPELGEYKTYTERPDIIDYGAFAGIEPIAKDVSGKAVVYRYAFDGDKYKEYIEVMKDNGYTFQALKDFQVYEEEIHSTYYSVIDYDNLDKGFCAYGTHSGIKDLKWYVVVVLETK